MLGTIVLAAVGVWIFVLVVVLGLCREAKARDQALETAHRRYRARAAEWDVADDPLMPTHSADAEVADLWAPSPV